MPSRRAISTFVLPVAGMMSSRSIAPGWEGQRLGFCLALYSLMEFFSFRALGEYGEKFFCSIDQTPARRRQERIVENIRCRRFDAEFDILCQLLDRSRETGRIDAADAAAFHLFGQDVVRDDG